LGDKRLTFVDLNFFIALFASIFLIPVDVILIAAKPLEPMPPSLLSSPMTAAVLLLFNAALLGTFLEIGSRKVTPGWRAGLVLLCSLPWAGLYAFPVRDRWAVERPACARTADLSLTAPGKSWWLAFRSLGCRWMRTIRTEWSLVPYLVANYAVVYRNLWNLPWRSWAVIIVAALLHALAAGGLTIHALTAPRQDRADSMSLSQLPFLLFGTLLPIPLCPLASFFLYSLALFRSSRHSLLQPLLQARGSTSRLPRWLELQEALRRARGSLPWWKRLRFSAPDRVRSSGESDHPLLTLYSVKSAALVFDAAAVAWLACWLTEGSPTRRLMTKGLIGTVAGLSWLAGVFGLLLMLVRAIQQRFRVEGRLSFLDRHPLHRYLAASLITFAAGLVLGIPLYEKNAVKLGSTLSTMALYGVVASMPRSFFPAPSERKRSETALVWMLVFCLVGLVGLSPWFNQALLYFFAHFYIPVFEACITVIPFFACIIVPLRYLGMLLRPFNPDDTWNPTWSCPLRHTLRFMTVTAALPLGGLAVPAWIWIRYRWWSDFEREWHERVSRS